MQNQSQNNDLTQIPKNKSGSKTEGDTKTKVETKLMSNPSCLQTIFQKWIDLKKKLTLTLPY